MAGARDSDTVLALDDAHAWYESETTVFLGVFAMMFVVMLLLLLGFLIERTRTRFVPLTGFALILGSFLGLFVRVVTAEDNAFRELLIFDEDFFFVMLLPPIIFESGYSMKRGNFFRSAGAIALLAWVGTLFSAFFVGAIVYAASAAGSLSTSSLSFVECMIFGALISATDPVSVLAVFRKLGVDKDLNAIVFGESVLNDAVAIVLVKTLVPFLGDAQFNAGSLFEALGRFVLVFAGSVALGSFFALASALLFKHTALYEHPVVETSVLVLLAYQAYMLAEGVHLSGIVTILFCALVMAHYTANNLSRRGQALTKDLFHVLAMVAELFIFAYLGLALFSIEHIYDPRLIVLVMGLILVARGLHVVSLVALVNHFRGGKKKGKNGANDINNNNSNNNNNNNNSNSNNNNDGSGKIRPIPWTHQVVIWFSGLRGAIAFALAMSVNTVNSDVLLSTTLIIVLITVLIFGTATEPLVAALGIETGIDYDAKDKPAEHSSGDNDYDNDNDDNNSNDNITETGPTPSTSTDDIVVRMKDARQRGKRPGFVGFDKRYLVPFFTRGLGIKHAPEPGDVSHNNGNDHHVHNRRDGTEMVDLSRHPQASSEASLPNELVQSQQSNVDDNAGHHDNPAPPPQGAF